MSKGSYHITHNYLLNPNHKISVNLIGIGGTGSYLITKLALLNCSLMALGHIGIEVRAWDDDKVSPANMGRQLYHESDIGLYKSEVMINRINFNFGLDWKWEYTRFGENTSNVNNANITISCVDSVKSRKSIKDNIASANSNNHATNFPFYWIDCGNDFRSGQVILSYNDPDKRKKGLPDFFDMFGKVKETNNTPSCSVTDSLNKQDLFINSFMADVASHMLWTLFRYGKIDYRAVFINIENMEMNKIKI